MIYSFSMETLAVKSLVKKFGAHTAVDGISFSVQAGEIFGLLGPNGAGKTTTIQTILDVITPDSGQIEVFGLPFPTHREEILGQMNFSSSYVSLPWNLTVEENLAVFSKLYSLPSPKQRIHELLELFSIADERKTMTGKLSSGQLTRLFLAKALLNHPRLLLLDEPTASLDPDIAQRTRELIKNLARQEKTSIIYTSHNMTEIENMCDRVAFLQHGRFLVVGKTQEILKRYGHQNLEEAFIHFVRSLEQTPETDQ